MLFQKLTSVIDHFSNPFDNTCCKHYLDYINIFKLLCINCNVKAFP